MGYQFIIVGFKKVSLPSIISMVLIKVKVFHAKKKKKKREGEREKGRGAKFSV